MEVNVIGLLTVTKSFIPLLKLSKGRIINIGSTSGFLAFPGSSAYSGSKFAVRAITDSLRNELKFFDIYVSLVSPGAVKSEIWNKSKTYKEKIRKSVSKDILNDYEVFTKYGEKLLQETRPISPNEVARAVYHALSSNKPKIYYNVGSDCKMAIRIAKLPKSLLDKLILGRIKKFGRD
jgi:short-subunit dehydrogenase